MEDSGFYLKDGLEVLRRLGCVAFELSVVELSLEVFGCFQGYKGLRIAKHKRFCGGPAGGEQRTSWAWDQRLCEGAFFFSPEGGRSLWLGRSTV